MKISEIDKPLALKIMSIFAAVYVAISLFMSSALRSTIDDLISMPANFRIRAALDRDPRLSDKIKVFGVDDSAVANFGRTELTLPEWTKIFQELTKAGAKTILVDKIFGSPNDMENASDFINVMKKEKLPVFSGVFLTSNTIPLRSPLVFSGSAYDMRLYRESRDKPKIDTGSELDWIPRNSGFAYAAHDSISEAFKKFGHIVYRRSGFVDPFLRMSQTNAIPHLSFQGSGFFLEEGELFTQTGKVPIYDDGSIVVNFADFRESKGGAFASIKSLQWLLSKGYGFDKIIKKDQIVVILPNLYTGGTDWITTPLGHVPGGHVVISLLNSAVTGKWITPIPFETTAVVFAIFLGCLLGFVLNGIRFWVLLPASAVILILGGIGSFVYLSLFTPWVFATAGFLFAGLATFSVQSRRRDRTIIALESALGTMVSGNQLNHIKKSPGKLQLEPSTKMVSIVFVDIVGFALISEELSPKDVFHDLRTILTGISKIVHEHNGIIDKSTGDGLLCYFGCDLSGNVVSDHVDQALKCAIEIQKKSINPITAADFEKSSGGSVTGDSSGRVYPLRIGLNTANVLIGNVGTDKRFDITLIGNGVNFSARLESACDPFKVMMGTSTKELLTAFKRDDKGFNRKLIMVKHYSEPQVAFEFNPFYSNPEYLTGKIMSSRKGDEVKRISGRVFTHEIAGFEISTSVGVFKVLDYSSGGFRMIGSQYLARNVDLRAHLKALSESFMREIGASDVSPFNFSVRWSCPTDEGFEHGIKVVGLNQGLLKKLFDACETANISSKSDKAI